MVGLLPPVNPATSGINAPWSMPAPGATIQRATQMRDKIASIYDEAISFSQPGRPGINRTGDDVGIYDDTAVDGLPQFGSRIQQGTMPSYGRWTALMAAIPFEDDDDRLETAAKLEAIDQIIFDNINNSAMPGELHETFQDLALGTGAIKITPGMDTHLTARAIPPGALLFEVGPDGLPGPIYELISCPANEVRLHWQEARIPDGCMPMDGKNIELVEEWRRDWAQPTIVRYRRAVYLKSDPSKVLLTDWHEGAGCCEIIVCRWNKASGEAWGRGPLVNCLSSLRKVNFAEQALLDHTEMALGGIWTLEDYGTIAVKQVRLEPGTVIPQMPGSKGLQRVDGDNGAFDVASFTLQDARMGIKRALYLEQLGRAEGTPMSATEVQQRMAELARSIGSSFGRIVTELVMPVIVRVTYILQKRGLFKMPDIDGKKVKLMPTSPLAQAQNYDEIQSLDAWASLVEKHLGPEMAQVMMDTEKLAVELHERFRLPKSVLRTQKAREALMARMQEALAANAEQPTGPDPAAGEGAL